MLGIGRSSGRAAAAIVIIYFRGPPSPRGILAKSPAGRLSPDSLPREPILGSIKSGFLCRNGPPKKRTPKSKIKSRIISLGGISLPRETILGSIKSGFLCRNGHPKKSSPKTKINSRIISVGEISLPREPILDSVIAWPCSACSACSA